jgi:hypothetical protein
MKSAIMQPYFFPYIGYFQLMNAVDEFIVYDNIEFTKKGWINRNRILVNGQDAYITLPLKKDSDFLDVVDRYLPEIWPDERRKLLNRLTESYRKAPYFKTVFPIIEDSTKIQETNLFRFLLSTLTVVRDYLGITTPFVVSSSVEIDHTLRAEEKVIALCKARGADVYINPIGGLELYSKERFRQNNIDLLFLKADNVRYPQLSNEFVPFLSIIDVMMFNPRERIREFLNQYTIQ